MTIFSTSDFRLPISVDALKKLVDATVREYRVLELHDALIAGNGRINDIDAQWKNLTEGQRIVVRLATFDSQILNGGLEQYFWNAPTQAVDVVDDLRAIDAGELSEAYETALQELAGEKSSWLELRARFTGHGDADLDLFRESAELLDLAAFNSAYYGEFDEQGGQTRPGWGDLLGECLMRYVLEHPEEFCSGK